MDCREKVLLNEANATWQTKIKKEQLILKQNPKKKLRIIRNENQKKLILIFSQIGFLKKI